MEEETKDSGIRFLLQRLYVYDIGPKRAFFSEGPLKLSSQGPSCGPRGSLEALVKFLIDPESVST